MNGLTRVFLTGLSIFVAAPALSPVSGQTSSASVAELNEGGKVCSGSVETAPDPRPLPAWIHPAMSAMSKTPTVMTFSFQEVGEDRIIFAVGEIDARASERLKAVMERFAPITEIRFNSPGGDSAQGEAIGRLIRSAGTITTRITEGNGCASACSTAFLGGLMRRVEPGALYGIHLFSRAYHADVVVPPEDWPRITQQEAKLVGGRAIYVGEMGISREWIRKWIDTPSACMIFFSQQELRDSVVANW